MEKLSKNQYRCKQGETVTFTIKPDQTRFGATRKFLLPANLNNDIDPATGLLVFTVNDDTVLKIDYNFFGPAVDFYTTTTKGSDGGGTFTEKINRRANPPEERLYSFTIKPA